MLRVSQFDIKTGKPITITVEGRKEPAIKAIENSYLEHWCKVNGIDMRNRFSIAKFYPGIHDSDRQQLEAEGKYLIFSSGEDGYFTDYETAQLMSLGSETIQPIYAGNQNAAHNLVAYGSLIASDGIASTTLSSARILIIDDENRSHGGESLIDNNGRSLSLKQLNTLYDKMGDGTMLVTERIMRSLQTGAERAEIVQRAAEKSNLSGDLSTLLQDTESANASAVEIEKQAIALSQRSVYQFRTATPDLPGIAKGTMSSSQWCDRLGVDAIISLSDIKGDDGRLSRPGLRNVSNFWINRKATAKYGQQSVGPQVKYTIPEATRLEINPKVQEKAQKLAEVAGNFDTLSQRYLEHKEYEHSRPYQSEGENAVGDTRPDWLYEVIKNDRYGQLTDQASIVRELSYYIRGEWRRLASNGTSVPSAMAQHHSQLKPWEVSNKDLPHGAIVAYYRSPFPNVGAAAIAVNNVKLIEQQDEEAHLKRGVAYLPPGTAKNVAITDFDGDTNGFFVGYEATVDDLPEKIRAQLAGIEELSPAKQYEACRALVEDLIWKLEQEQQNALIKPSIYPVAVREFAERNAPDVRPPRIVKQQKESHSWQRSETLSTAVWRAWKVTADNPIGRVANAGMSLQALSLELRYAPVEEEEILLKQVSKRFSSILKQNSLTTKQNAEIDIPSEEWLLSQGFSGGYAERMKNISDVGRTLETLKHPQQRQKFIESHLVHEALQEAAIFLSEVANGPNALNIQIAVDSAKSAKGIDESLHQFIQSLQYKPDEFRRNKDNPSVYIDGQVMPTSIEDPVSLGVQIVNEHYVNAQLQERKHEAFQAIFPKGETPHQRVQAKTIIQTNSALIKQVAVTKSRHRKRLSADRRPTVKVTTQGGRLLTFQNIPDAQGRFPWRGEGSQPERSIAIARNPVAEATKRQFTGRLTFIDGDGKQQTEPLGYLTEASVRSSGIEERLKLHQSLTIQNPTLEMQVPWSQENDARMLYAQRTRYLEQALAPPEGKDPQVHAQEMAQALWRQSMGGRKLAMQYYSDVVADRLRTMPTIVIGRLQIAPDVTKRLIDKSPHIIQFSIDKFSSKAGALEKPSVAILTAEGDRFLLGAVADRDIALPPGATYMAAFYANAKSQKVVDMQVMEIPTLVQTSEQMSALQAGRRHITLMGVPYATYGIREGQLLLAKDERNSTQIALRAGKQHQITRRLVNKEGVALRWAEAEKLPPQQLARYVGKAETEGKALWGLNIQVLGTYRKGQIQPIESVERLKQANEIASAVKRTYAELVDESGVAETKNYRIALSEDQGVLTLTSKEGETLATFSMLSDHAVSAETFSEEHLAQWRVAKAAIETTQQQAHMER